jgi:hypothetical protein
MSALLSPKQGTRCLITQTAGSDILGESRISSRGGSFPTGSAACGCNHRANALNVNTEKLLIY